MDLQQDLPPSVEDLFREVLSMDVRANGRREHPVALATCVHILGSWNGIVVISACGDATTSIATSYLETEAESLSSADRVDSFAEFGNELAGNIKGMLEGTNRLTLPVVANGSSIEVPSGREQAACTFSMASGGALSVQIFSNAASDTLAEAR